MAQKLSVLPTLTPQQAKVLAASFDEYSAYFEAFAAQHFPQLNLVMVDMHDPERDEKLRAKIIGQLDRPEVQRRMTEISYTEALPILTQYAEQIVQSLRADEADDAKRFKEMGIEFIQLGGYKPNFPDYDISRIGAQVAPITINGQHCKSCTPDQNLLEMTCSDILPDRTAVSQMQRLETGFHELAHAVDLHGRTYPGVVLDTYFSPRDRSNRLEATAHSFQDIMMVREFGSIGRDYIDLKIRSAGASPVHTTFRAGYATKQWLDDNQERLQDMSPLELFEVAKTIAARHALTAAELKMAESYHRTYNKPEHFTQGIVEARIIAGTAYLNGNGPPVPGYSSLGLEIDYDFLKNFQTIQKKTNSFTAKLLTAQSCPVPSGLVDTDSLSAALTSITEHILDEPVIDTKPAEPAKTIKSGPS